ncbi:MAG TPA: DUF1203 domain-containing protein [Actinotalea caeni]|uniref:DUF1203 domain-containing protein n=1 Tax=Actinotalea caeni TaxID=1348467 RepID=UPI002B4AECA2|nr:DUF1203 domain-containing protein [Actinotalea caeni]HLV55363.1 DUF1203 domain-containing protein [Actinotalea caeni]
MSTRWSGVSRPHLSVVLRDGVDDLGNAVDPFVDAEGGWWLRCCLAHSRPGDTLAIIGFSAFPWHGPFRESGPVVVHADLDGCPGHDGGFPVGLAGRPRVLRAYGDDAGRARTQVYDLNRVVGAEEDLAAHVERVLADPRVRRVHLHHPVAGCFTAAAERV